MRTLILCCFLWFLLPCGGAERDALLWREPGNVTAAGWIWGAGGEARAPKGPFQFVEEDFSGTNPKLRVVDAKGDRWTVKFGPEGHTDVFATRLLFAVGYSAEPTYYVRSGVVTGAAGLKRAKPFVGTHGEIAYARFKLHHAKKVDHAEGLEWSWTNNPFLGTHELNGLKILMMLLSNWDAKDSRDGQGSNTAVYAKAGPSGDQLYYAFDDWGATLGKWGGFFSRTKWNAYDFSGQTRAFAVSKDGETIRWRYRGKHAKDITSGIRMEDVRWLLTYLARVTDEDLRAGLRASGAGERETGVYARSIRERISQLQRLSESANSTQSTTLP